MKVLTDRLRRVAAAAAIVAVAMSATQAVARDAVNTAGIQTIPLTVLNKAGYRGKVFVFIYGMSGATWYRVINTKGDVAAFPNSAVYKPYGFKFKKKKKRIKLRLPELTGARVYISYGKPMKFSSPGGKPSTPEGWDSSDTNYNTLFDWFEYSWGVQQPPVPPLLPAGATYLNGNQTQVDMIGIPMLYTFKGLDANANPTTVSGGFNAPGARTDILGTMRKAGLPWSKLVITKGRSELLRAISPYNGIAMTVFPSTQLDGYINQVWGKYVGSKTMTATTTGPTQNFTGKVTGGNLVFNRASPAGTVTFSKPSTVQVYKAWSPTVSPSGDANLQTGAGELETMVQAGFLRSTILANADISECPGPAAYYKNAPVDMYSKIIHQFAYQHKAYGFGYDDVCSQGSDGQVFNPTSVTLKIPKFVKKRR